MKIDAQAIELYNAIEEAIKLYGSAEALMKTLKKQRLMTGRKAKTAKKWLMRWLRIKTRIEKGLSVYGKGGIVLNAAKTN